MQPRLHDRIPLALKIISLSFYNNNMIELCFLTSKYFAVIFFDVYVKKHSLLFSRCNVGLHLNKLNSVEVILVNFTMFSIDRVFLGFKNFYSILKFRHKISVLVFS